MKKYVLVAALGLLTTAAVTATVLSTGERKAVKDTSKEKTEKQKPVKKSSCSKAFKIACY